MDNKDKILILRKLIDYIQMTDANFGQSIGVSKSEIPKYLNVKQPITDKLIRKIIANYPNTNPTWLLLGVGDMHNPSITINSIERNDVLPSACTTAGVRIEVVSKMFAHAEIQTTQIYAKVLAEDIEKGLDAIDK